MEEVYKNMVSVKPKEKIPFKCIGCGECCRHVKEQVPIEALDAFRIARYLRDHGEDILSVNDFLEKYAEPALLNECGYFVYFLKTQGVEDACVFLENNRCRIHAANPRACRIYPFVAAPSDKGGFEYLISYEYKQHFKGAAIHPKTWMKKRFTLEDQAFLNADFGSAKEIAWLLRKIPEDKKVKALAYFQHMKYGGFALDKPFQPQYERNIQTLLKYLRDQTNRDESI